MLLSRKAVNWDLDSAPTRVASTLPFLNSISVGMPRMPNFAGVSWFSSTLIFAILAAPLGPVIDQHRGLGLQDLGLERVIGHAMNRRSGARHGSSRGMLQEDSYYGVDSSRSQAGN
jgi:hypothetical protein